MALDRTDIELLKGAKEKGMNIDQMIESAENMLNMNEMKDHLKDIGNRISFKLSGVIDENIESIIKIESDDDKLKFIIQKGFEAYSEDQKIIEDEAKELEAAQEKREAEAKEREEKAEQTETEATDS